MMQRKCSGHEFMDPSKTESFHHLMLKSEVVSMESVCKGTRVEFGSAVGCLTVVSLPVPPSGIQGNRGGIP